MVQIYIKTSDENEKIEEWSIIELQGDLEVDSGETLTNKFMADLHYTNEGVPILILGNHVLYGKMITLEKPYVLITRKREAIQNNNELLMKDDDDDDDNSVHSEKMNESMSENRHITTYIVKAVVKRKLLFNKRPRPIVYIESAIKNRS